MRYVYLAKVLTVALAVASVVGRTGSWRAGFYGG